VELGRTLTRLGDFTGARAELNRVASDIERSHDVGSLPLLNAALGQLEYEMGHVAEATTYFGRASAAWPTDGFPEDSSVESRAYLGLLQGLRGERARGMTPLLESLHWARQTNRVLLEARCLLFMARIELAANRIEDAVARLSDLPEERRRRLNPELQSYLRYWYGKALAQQGRREAAAVEAGAARTILEDWGRAIPEVDRSRVLSRPDIRLIIGNDASLRP
jgi:tetratricopeptide (TPR) repeat protein